MKLPRFNEKTKFYTALAVCLGLFSVHLMNIVKFAVNIPYWDEWEAIAPGGVIASPGPAQIFAQHNEHRIATTKLFTLVQYEINGWNVTVNLALNFIIYGLLVVVLARLVKKCAAPQLPAWVVLCFTVFLFSSLSWENHFWAFQSTFHFSLLFLFLSVLFLFDEKQIWRKILAGVFFSWIAIYSMSGGLVGSVVLVFGYACFKALRLRRGGADKRQNEAAQMIAVLLLIGGAIGLYFVGYVKPAHHPPLSLPFALEFWIYFFNLLSSGFGHRSAHWLPGFFIFIFIFVPVAGVIWKQRFALTAQSFAIITSILAITASLCSITMGRAGFELSQSKSSRYCEIVGMLIPLTVAMWSIFLSDREKMRNRLLLIFWLFCAVTFVKHWNFPRTYQRLARDRQIGAQCVRDYYLQGGEAKCLNIYPVPIADRLDYAKRLKLSFIEENSK